jgi:hypothetical protein
VSPGRRRRSLGLGLTLLVTLGGCSRLGPSNGGIAALEQAGEPVTTLAVGAKYAGWVLSVPLVLAACPIAALAWALPWVDLPDAVDVATAPAVGLGWATQALVGGPAYGLQRALASDEPASGLRPAGAWTLPRGPWVPWGFVVDHHRQRLPVRPAGPLSRETQDYYALPPGAAEALAADARGVWPRDEVIRIRLDEGLGLAATLELYPAADHGRDPRPLLLLTPPTEATFAARYQARRAVERGIHAALIVPDTDFLEPHLTPVDVEAKLRGSVVVARVVLAALRGLPGVDPDQVGYVGISAGGIFGAVLLAVEPGIQRGVLMLAGGDLARIVRVSDESTVTAYREAWAARGVAPDELAAQLTREVRSDPLRLARHVDPARVMLFVAAQDTAVPTDTGLALHHALGGPEAYLLRGGHRSAGLCFGFVLREAERFLFPSVE